MACDLFLSAAHPHSTPWVLLWPQHTAEEPSPELSHKPWLHLPTCSWQHPQEQGCDQDSGRPGHLFSNQLPSGEPRAEPMQAHSQAELLNTLHMNETVGTQFRFVGEEKVGLEISIPDGRLFSHPNSQGTQNFLSKTPPSSCDNNRQ